MTTVKIKVADATENQIDWLVAKIEGVDLTGGLTDDERYSTSWALGGPIIERKEIDIERYRNDPYVKTWFATQMHNPANTEVQRGETPLIAAMRCHIVGELGEEVEIPKGLV